MLICQCLGQKQFLKYFGFCLSPLLYLSTSKCVTTRLVSIRLIQQICMYYFTYFRLLNVIEKSEDDTNETLMSRVEVAISLELNISTSNITKNDKVLS